MPARPYATAPALPGYEFRHYIAPDDLPGMNQVANAMRMAGGEQWLTTLEQFSAFYEHLSNCDPATDVVVAERDGRVVGYGRASWYEDLEGQRLYEPIAFADPGEPPALWEALHEATEGRGREVAATHPDGAKHFQTETIETARERVAFLERRGYEPARYAFQMVRPNLDDLPDSPLPAGLEIRPVQPEQLRAIWEAEVEAMRDHWGMGLPTDADYQNFLTDPVHGQYALWRVAWDGDQVAGMVRGFINPEENARYGRNRGWVENINVRRPWRRRGLARALIAATITALRERGMTEGALGVDTENLSGALHLYESCGFVAVKREIVYRKPLV